MSVRIVVYAEGSEDSAGESWVLPPPGETLGAEHMGPVQVVTGRCVEREWSLPMQAVQFLSPLRLRTGKRPKGSHLLVREILRQLLTWPAPRRRPDLAIVFVDHDDDPGRKNTLEGFVSDLPLGSVIAVPIQEMEAWLIADHAAVVSALGHAPRQPRAVEALPRRAAKDLLNGWIAHSQYRDEPRKARLTLARTSSLRSLDQLGAFQAFCSDLRARKPA